MELFGYMYILHISYIWGRRGRHLTSPNLGIYSTKKGVFFHVFIKDSLQLKFHVSIFSFRGVRGQKLFWKCLKHVEKPKKPSGDHYGIPPIQQGLKYSLGDIGQASGANAWKYGLQEWTITYWNLWKNEYFIHKFVLNKYGESRSCFSNCYLYLHII